MNGTRLKSVHELLKVSSKDIQNSFRAYPSVMVFLGHEQISIKDFILLLTNYMMKNPKSKLSNNTNPR